MGKDFADTFVSFARGEIGKDEMDKAVRRLSQDAVRGYEPRKGVSEANKSQKVAETASSKR